MELRVRERRLVADSVVELVLVDQDGGLLPAWSAGSHVDVVLPSGIVRQYSLTGDPSDRHCYRLGVGLAEPSRGGSEEVHNKVDIGDTLVICGPRNNFALLSRPRYTFVAGGIGITPILSMIRTAHARGAQWTLHYGGRSTRSMAFLDELAQYGDRVKTYPEDISGLIPLNEALGSADDEVYCCGPEPLLDAALTVMQASGRAHRLHIERFAPRVVEHDPDQQFEVEFAQSGVTVTVAPGQTIAQAARNADLLVFTSCEEGMCGTCETRVLEGIPEHRDSMKSADEHDHDSTMAICISRALTPRLILDL